MDTAKFCETLIEEQKNVSTVKSVLGHIIQASKLPSEACMKPTQVSLIHCRRRCRFIFSNCHAQCCVIGKPPTPSGWCRLGTVTQMGFKGVDWFPEARILLSQTVRQSVGARLLKLVRPRQPIGSIVTASFTEITSNHRVSFPSRTPWHLPVAASYRHHCVQSNAQLTFRNRRPDIYGFTWYTADFHL